MSSSTEQLHDLRRRHKALDCLAIGTLLVAAAAWSYARLTPASSCERSLMVRPVVEVEPLVEPIPGHPQVVTTVELIDE